jgi:spoIIIJ-associated protein
MSSSDSIEVTAATVDAAISSALQQLGAAEDDVTIEVLSTPRSGVLGLGARQARVRVTRREPELARSGVTSPPPAPPPRPRAAAAPKAPPPPRPVREPQREPTPQPPPREQFRETPREEPRTNRASEQVVRADAGNGTVIDDEDEGPPRRREIQRSSGDLEIQTREATTILARILELMGEKAEIEQAGESEPDTVELNVKGDGSGLLIGRHGQTLDALEYLVNRALARKIKDAAPISIDTESYRARRRQQLHRMALSKGEQAKREHVAVTLDPMPPRDRRIIHLALKDDPMISTRSSGDGFLRSIQIVPANEHRQGAGPRGGQDRRRDRGRGRPSPPPAPGPAATPPIGESGGFKHGQKRIV